MHYYFKEYFDYLYEIYNKDKSWVKPYDVFIENLIFIEFNIDELNGIISEKFPLIDKLYDGYVNKRIGDRQGDMDKLYFVGSSLVLVNYGKELDIILRKSKINKLIN